MPRKDQLQISLGSAKEQHKANLKALAVSAKLLGRKGDGSISELMMHLSECYEADPEAVEFLFDMMSWMSGGADWDDLYDLIKVKFID